MSAQGAAFSSLNITGQTVLSLKRGQVWKIVVNTAGSGAGTLSDVTTIGAVAAGNLICNIPATAGLIDLNGFPFDQGLIITPGTGQVLAVSWS